MVGILILLFWYLKKFHLEVAYPILHLLKVLFHPFVLIVIVAINLIGHYLGIAVQDHIYSSCCFCEIQPRYQGFILCLVIGRREIKTDHAFDLIPFWVVEYHYPTCLLVGRSVRVDAPLWARFCPLAFHESELCNEVSDHLPLYGRTWLILYVKLSQLNRLQRHLSGSFRATQCPS